jgi:hypothetical protein
MEITREQIIEAVSASIEPPDVMVVAPSVEITGFDNPLEQDNESAQLSEIEFEWGFLTVVRDKWCPADKAYFVDWLTLEGWTRELHNKMIREKLHG